MSLTVYSILMWRPSSNLKAVSQHFSLIVIVWFLISCAGVLSQYNENITLFNTCWQRSRFTKKEKSAISTKITPWNNSLMCLAVKIDAFFVLICSKILVEDSKHADRRKTIIMNNHSFHGLRHLMLLFLHMVWWAPLRQNVKGSDYFLIRIKLFLLSAAEDLNLIALIFSLCGFSRLRAAILTKVIFKGAFYSDGSGRGGSSDLRNSPLLFWREEGRRPWAGASQWMFV